MKESILIENFGGLNKVEFDFKPINILIGPQASGKSIIVKLTYYFKNFFTDIFNSIDNGENKRQLDERQKEKFYTYFPREAWGKGSFIIKYFINESYVFIEKSENTSLKFDYSDDLRKIFNKGKDFYKDEQKKIQNDPKISNYRVSINARNRFYECLSKEISPLSINNQFFVPAGRSFFANVQSSIFSFLSDNRSIDPFLIEFGSFYENFKRILIDIENDKKRKKNGFDELISNIMNGTYVREKEKDYLLHRDARKVNMVNASSGQQEVLPLMLVLKILTNIRFGNGGATLYIEEPEAHLFPTAQKNIVRLLARTYNNVNANFQIFVTTHSPYILSSFNNLIEAGKIIEDNKHLMEKVNEIIPNEEILKSRELVAYSLNNGNKITLIDETSKLISQNILDSVSDEISLEFGKLIDLEF